MGPAQAPGTGGGTDGDPDLADEVRRLRAELVTSRAASGRALARATRLAQLISALGQLTDLTTVFDRAVCEVAEQFSTDVAAILVPDGDGMRLAAQWGVAARHAPQGRWPVPSPTARLTPAVPVVAAPVDGDVEPAWLAPSAPRHLAWGLLAARDETLGHLLLARRADEPFTPAEIQELGSVASRIAMAVDNGRLHQRTQEQLHRMRQLHEATSALAGLVDREQAARAVARTLVREVPLTGAAVYLTAAAATATATATPTAAEAAGDGAGGRLELAAHAGAVEHPGVLPARGEPWDRPDVAHLELRAGTSRLGRVLLSGAPPRGGEAWTFLEHLTDIGALVLQKALLFDRLRTQAETDALTGLPNRSLFMKRLTVALSAARQHGDDLGVVFVDLDGFKAVNDVHGHAAGDQLLVEVARRLVVAVRHQDTAARLGGDEFVVLCEDVRDDELRAGVGRRIQHAVDAPFTLDVHGDAVRVDAGGSVGIATARRAGYDPHELLRAADIAMYAAKQRRRTGPVEAAGGAVPVAPRRPTSSPAGPRVLQ